MEVKWVLLEDWIVGAMRNDGDSKTILLNKEHSWNQGISLARVLGHELVHYLISTILLDQENPRYHVFWDCFTKDIDNFLFRTGGESKNTLKFIRGKI